MFETSQLLLENKYSDNLLLEDCMCMLCACVVLHVLEDIRISANSFDIYIYIYIYISYTLADLPST